MKRTAITSGTGIDPASLDAAELRFAALLEAFSWVGRLRARWSPVCQRAPHTPTRKAIAS
jgi:hypothetical protein